MIKLLIVILLCHTRYAISQSSSSMEDWEITKNPNGTYTMVGMHDGKMVTLLRDFLGSEKDNSDLINWNLYHGFVPGLYLPIVEKLGRTRDLIEYEMYNALRYLNETGLMKEDPAAIYTNRGNKTEVDVIDGETVYHNKVPTTLHSSNATKITKKTIADSLPEDGILPDYEWDVNETKFILDQMDVVDISQIQSFIHSTQSPCIENEHKFTILSFDKDKYVEALSDVLSVSSTEINDPIHAELKFNDKSFYCRIKTETHCMMYIDLFVLRCFILDFLV